jgi:hypothetical protein
MWIQVELKASLRSYAARSLLERLKNSPHAACFFSKSIQIKRIPESVTSLRHIRDASDRANNFIGVIFH